MNTSFFDRLKFQINLLGFRFAQYRLSTNETAIIDTECGQVRGIKRKTIYDVPFYSFEGIPYAKPPVGELRFKAPEKHEPWQGVLDCYSVKNKAPQISLVTGKIEGSENCLYLSVYAPKLKPDKPAPVMVWIHGGGFLFGEADREFYGPDYFMEKDVILVTVQYRVGVLGFLNLNSPELNVPGNAGLKDLILALKWVKNNIANFGGDPNCVTVFGESAGGAAVHYLCITEQTRGLFQRAIIMSGIAIAYWANNEHEQLAYPLAQMAGYKGENDEKQILEFLMQSKAAVLAQAEAGMLFGGLVKTKYKLWFPFVPVVEKYETPHCVISKSPRELMKTTWSNQIPILVGCTSNEGLMMTMFADLKKNRAILDELKTCLNYVPNELLDYEHKEERAEKLRKAHIKSENPTAEEYVDIRAYEVFYFPQHRFILSRMANAPTAPTYVYRFDYESEALAHPYRAIAGERLFKGVSHGDEITFLFSHSGSYRVPKDKPEYETIKRMTGIWTKFAATGNPNDKDIKGMDSLNWEPVKELDPAYKCLNISDELEIKDWPELNKSKVWESIYEGRKELLY